MPRIAPPPGPITAAKAKAEALARAREAGLLREVAEIGFHDAIHHAHELGVPMREIAQHVGLSHQRIHQILRSTELNMFGKALGMQRSAIVEGARQGAHHARGKD